MKTGVDLFDPTLGIMSLVKPYRLEILFMNIEGDLRVSSYGDGSAGDVINHDITLKFG